MAAAGSPERESIRNTAAMINANAGWSTPSQAFLQEFNQLQKDQQKAAADASRPTFISGVFDLLSFPLYGLANALDESIAGHQSDSNDSVLRDAGQVIGGLAGGAVKGMGAGLRGATSILDAIPGVSIDDEWQSNPQDKTRFGDVNIRLATKMSSADAAKPENFDEALSNARKEKAEIPGFLGDLLYGNLEQDDPEKEMKSLLKHLNILGIAEDIGGDPLNYATFGASVPLTGTKAIMQGVDSARAVNKIGDITRGLNAPVGDVAKGSKFGAPAIAANGPRTIGELGPVDVPIAAPRIETPPAVASVSPSVPEIAPPTGNPGKIRLNAPVTIHPENLDRAIDLLKRDYPAIGFLAKGKLQGTTHTSKAYDEFFARHPGMSSKQILAISGKEDELRTILSEAMKRDQADLAAGGAKVPNPAPTAIPDAAESGLNIGSPGRHVDMPKSGRFKTLPAARGKKGLAVSAFDQGKMVKEIAKLAESGEKGWIYRAGDILGRHGIEFENTSRFLDLADDMVKKNPGFRHNAGKMAPLLASRIATDVEAASNIIPAERILNTLDESQIIAKPTKAKLRPAQARIANDVVRIFEKEVLGTAKPSGTYEGLATNVRAGLNARWSGPQQAKMWNHIVTKLKMVPAAQRYDIAAKILQNVEDYFITRGAIPFSNAAISKSVEGLRLSQVIMAIGPKTMGTNRSLVTRILAGDEKALATLTAEQRNAIEALKASEAMASAPAVAQGIASGKEMAKLTLDQRMSAGRMREMLRNIPKLAEKESIRLGAGPVGGNVTKQYLQKLMVNPVGVDSVLKAHSLKTTGWLADSGKMGAKFNPVDKEFLKSVTNAIAKAEQLPPPKQLGGISGPGALVKDWFGARFNAAYGVKNINPIFRRQQSSALSISARRAQIFNKLAREYPPKDVGLWHEAFRAAQANGITAGRVGALQDEVSKIMEDLFGGTGLRAGAIADSTVIGRGRLTMAEMNAKMQRFGLGEFQFKAGKFKNAAGETIDLSRGADWMKSWEHWDVKNPYDFLHRIQQAAQHAVHEKVIFDEIASRFGSPNKFGDVKYSINHPRLKGYYFNEEGARQGQQFLKILDEINTPNSKGMQHLDHVISKIKAALTIYIPSHHWTNLIGDVFLNWFAGVNDPRRYSQAVKVFASQTGRYGDDIAEFKNLVGPDALKQAMARGLVGTEALAESGLKVSAAGNAVMVTMRNGQKVTADMIYTAMMKEGVLPSARVLEEVTQDVTSVLDKWRPLGGKGQRGAHVISEIRDHIPRIAQFIDGLAKSRGSFAAASEASAAAVRKAHPDGLDLTQFERNVMKRIFPFYSWTRKAIPLAIEAAIVAGPKVMAYPRIMEIVAEANGISSAPGTDLFPTDQMFPDWIRERGVGPIAGGPGSYVVANPSTPALDIFTMLGKPGGTTLDMLNPIAKIPAELAQGATLGKQVPIDSNTDYLARQIPGISHAGRISGYYGTSDSVAESPEQRFFNLMNTLLGTKATQTGIYQKSAEFDLMEYYRQKANGNG